jgi:CHAD domain-containing protein
MEATDPDGAAHSPPHPSMNASTSRDRLWRKRLNELSAVWPDFVSGRTTGLHKTRVASRRIREALPIVGATASPAKVKKLSKKMRALTRSLGPIRELDVELDILDDKSKTEGVPGRVIEMVRREVASRRQALREDLAGKAPVADLKKLLKKLERVANSGTKGERREAKGERQKAKGEGHKAKGEGHKAKGERQKAQGTRQQADSAFEAQWRGVLAARLMRRAKAVAAALEIAGPLYVPERIHDVRISTKKLRYALEIARDAGVSVAAPLVRLLKRHQERLGHLHDLQMLLKHVRETEASPGVGSRVNDLSAYADSLDRECRRLHAGFVEHRAELSSAVRDVRHQVVPALTTPPRRQAHVAAARRPSVRPRRAK